MYIFWLKVFQNYSKSCPVGPPPHLDPIRSICILLTKRQRHPPPLFLAVELYWKSLADTYVISKARLGRSSSIYAPMWHFDVNSLFCKMVFPNCSAPICRCISVLQQASGQIFKDDVNGFTSTSDIVLLHGCLGNKTHVICGTFIYTCIL